MSKEHQKCPSCDLCATYFGNKKLLNDHNKEMHTETGKESESEHEEQVIDIIEEEKKSKKKKKKSRK